MDKNLIKASSNLDKNMEIAFNVLKGKVENDADRARLNLCLVNAAAILFLAGIVDNLPDGVQKCLDVINKGETYNKLQEFIKFSNKIDVAITGSK